MHGLAEPEYGNAPPRRTTGAMVRGLLVARGGLRRGGLSVTLGPRMGPGQPCDEAGVD
jgi:hypothetical protein